MQNQTEPSKAKTVIEGIPKGYELVRFGKPNEGDLFVNGFGDPTPVCMDIHDDSILPIIRKLPPSFRPFASAAEFEPHRDRWVMRKGDRGFFGTVVGYSDTEVTFSNINEYKATWAKAFEYVLFDNGEPFGVAT